MTLSPPLRSAEPSAAGVEFFEAKVRPVLAEHCSACHGAKKQNAGLRLDTVAGMRQGADSGPLLTPGDAGKSLLLKVVRREGDAPMPPKSTLPPDAVAALTAWVKSGAAYPDDQAVRPAAAGGRDHWAFQPVKDRTPPAVKDAVATATPVDRFVLAKLEEKGLTPAAPADRRTLLRRITFDLIGLPPTAAEAAAFEADRSPRRLRRGRRPAAGLAAVRRAVGPLLARRGPVRGHQGVRLPARTATTPTPTPTATT